MGWNDRLPEDPFIPSTDYYQEQDRYEEWLEYVSARAAEEELMLSSQNIDPAQLHQTKTPQEPPTRQGFLSRLAAAFFGSKVDEGKNTRTRDEKVPF